MTRVFKSTGGSAERSKCVKVLARVTGGLPGDEGDLDLSLTGSYVGPLSSSSQVGVSNVWDSLGPIVLDLVCAFLRFFLLDRVSFGTLIFFGPLALEWDLIFFLVRFNEGSFRPLLFRALTGRDFEI